MAEVSLELRVPDREVLDVRIGQPLRQRQVEVDVDGLVQRRVDPRWILQLDEKQNKFSICQMPRSLVPHVLWEQQTASRKSSNYIELSGLMVEVPMNSVAL